MTYIQIICPSFLIDNHQMLFKIHIKQRSNIIIFTVLVDLLGSVHLKVRI